MLVILDPLALVRRPVNTLEETVPMCKVIDPLALVYVAIAVDQTTYSICLVVGPLSLVHRSIWPNLHASACFEQSFRSFDGPLAEVSRTLILTLFDPYR